MKVKCKPDEFVPRKNFIAGSSLSYKEKLELMNVNPQIDFSKEFIDENGYSFLKKHEIPKK